jgi:hypothetical protein
MNLPDPSWDYAQIWQHCQLAKAKLDQAIAAMESEETANDAIDAVIIECLEAVQGQSLNALDCLPKWNKPPYSN